MQNKNTKKVKEWITKFAARNKIFDSRRLNLLYILDQKLIRVFAECNKEMYLFPQYFDDNIRSDPSEKNIIFHIERLEKQLENIEQKNWRK